METPKDMQSLIEQLDVARRLLQHGAQPYPVLHTARRRIERISDVLNRPFRIAILGETNSGKSTIANILAGEITLPALPVANTRLPTLLRHASAPVVEALHENGRKFPLSVHDQLPLGKLLRLEVGLPSEQLRRIEILDFPGGANPLFNADLAAIPRQGVDAAIWATVATQAWRETERRAWSKLPQRLRLRGLLAVTHSDLIGSEDDLPKLKARLRPVQKAHFMALCFVGAATRRSATATGFLDSGAAELRLAVQRLRQSLEDERRSKAARLTRRVASRALESMEHLEA
jgi:hypothetical protein